MYYDLKFPFRVAAEAGLAEDEDGNNAEAYIQTTWGNCKKPITEEQYQKNHELQCLGVAEAMGIEPDMITCITPEEYEANMEEEE